jgi:hypothetical protein
MSAAPHRSSAFVRRLARWWRNWTCRNAAQDEIRRLGPREVDRLAHDVGLTGADLRTLAGKWPDSAELLSRRLAALRLDEHELARSNPDVLRDLQRVCTLCAAKGRCEHDLADKPSDPVWQTYCPNAQTVAAWSGDE